MRNWWIKFGCFLTGYNYNIVKVSSEVVAKSVKRYTSALLIVSILWFFVGFMFTKRYMHGNQLSSLAGAVIMIIIIIQIERQIILSFTRNRSLYASRIVLAALMAVIGSVIIDQIMLKDDIELEKMNYIETRVNEILPERTKQFQLQIANLDTAIQKKDSERTKLIDEITKTPFIKTTISQRTPTKLNSSKHDSAGTTTEEKIEYVTTAITNSVPNPKIQLLDPLEKTITDLRKQKAQKDTALLNIRDQVKSEIESKTGFLDELKVMYHLVSSSPVALGVWLIWFSFLMMLEMLVVISKLNEKSNDYEETIKHHMRLQMRKLEVLDKAANIAKT